MQKAIPKHRPAKNPASQKAKQSPTKNRYKFQNNNAARKRAAQKRGGALKRAAPFLGCCFEIWIDFLKDLAWLFGWAFLLAGFFVGLCFGMAFSLESWPVEKTAFKKRPNKKNSFSKQRSTKKLVWKCFQKHFSPNLLFLNLFFDGLKRIPTKNDAEPSRN